MKSNQHYVRHFSGSKGFLSKVVELTKDGLAIDYNASRQVTRDLFLIVTKDEVTPSVKAEDVKSVDTVELTDSSLDDFDFEDLDSTKGKEISLEDKLNDLTKKADLIEFAKEQKIELTDNMVMPAQIKKYLKGVLGFE